MTHNRGLGAAETIKYLAEIAISLNRTGNLNLEIRLGQFGFKQNTAKLHVNFGSFFGSIEQRPQSRMSSAFAMAVQEMKCSKKNRTSLPLTCSLQIRVLIREWAGKTKK